LYGNLDNAQKTAEKARLDFSATNPEWSMKFRLLEAEIRTYQGRRPEVISLLNCDDTSFPATGDTAIKRYLLCGQAHARLGQAQESDRELAQALRLSHSSGSPLQGELLLTEGHVQFYRGHLNQAAYLYKESLQAARRQNDVFLEASDLLNLGMVSLGLNHYDEASTYFKGCADLAKEIGARPAIEAAQGDTGVASFHLGDFEKALSDFQQAEEEAKEIGTTSAQADWLWDAGTCHYHLGDLEKAASYLQQALDLAHKIDNPEEISAISTQLGFLLYDEKQYAAAKTLSDEAITAARKAGDQSAEAEALFLQAMLATQQPGSQLAEHLLLEVLQKSSAIPSQQSTIENELANFYNRRRQPKKADLWYRKSIATFERDRAAIQNEELRLPFFANGETLYRQYADFLIDTDHPTRALALLDQGRARTLSEGLGQSPSTEKADLQAQAVAQKLNATILFYSLGPDKSYLWAINAHRTNLFVLPKASEIESRVQAYDASILKSTDPLHTSDANARRLYDALVAPAAEMLPPGSRVVLIPDGALNTLNFETLLTPAPHYWIEDVTIVNANSIRMLSSSQAHAKYDKANTLLLMGDPILASKDYATLPNAPLEIGNVEKHFPPASRTTLTQAAAIPSAYASSGPEKFSYIHFVAHGTASRLSPLDSAVVLSAIPGQPENFKLYARDIVHHPLHAKLVTISACYGSGLRAYAGEGLVGLSWAFLRAGSHNVIGALWEANDASTPLLMDRLYSEIGAGSTPEAALRAAKLSLIHSINVYRKPLYWAAFQLYAGS
jgi:CHAT domain-containing protein